MAWRWRHSESKHLAIWKLLFYIFSCDRLTFPLFCSQCNYTQQDGILKAKVINKLRALKQRVREIFASERRTRCYSDREMLLMNSWLPNCLSVGHLKIVGTRRVICRKIHNEDTQLLGARVKIYLALGVVNVCIFNVPKICYTFNSRWQGL
jgi:hypothetical protein